MEQQLFGKITNHDGILWGLRHERTTLSKIYDYKYRVCMDKNEDFTEWLYRIEFSMNKISTNYNELVEINNFIDIHTTLRDKLECNLRKFQNRYTQTDTFCIDRFKVGTLIEWDDSNGGNDVGVQYRITKVTSNYIDAVCLLNNELEKITNPRHIRRINNIL